MSFNRQRLLFSIDILIIACLACFICFWNLGVPSFHPGDEATHVRVTQEMLKGGSFFIPTLFGEPYMNKPPLKMWLSVGVVKALGESNFNYRILDATLGVITCLMIYLAGRLFFRSRVAAWLSALFLLGSKEIFFSHCFRAGNLDSLLVMLSTAACVLAWVFLRDLRLENQPTLRFKLLTCLAGGTMLGLAMLTKNVAGYVPLGIIGFYLLLSGDLRQLKLRDWGAIALCLIAALVIPALYFIPRCTADAQFCRVLAEIEVEKRMMVGMHHVAETWHYLKRLVIGRTTVPPEVVFPAIFFALYRFFRNRERAWLYCLIWPLLPYTMYTIIPSRNDWYILPAVPGAALLCGGFTAVLIKEAFSREFSPRWQKAAYRVAATLAIALLILHLSMCVRRVLRPKGDQLALDKAVHQARAAALQHKSSLPVLVKYGEMVLARNEVIYWDFLSTKTIPNTPEALAQELATSQKILVLTQKQRAAEAKTARQPLCSIDLPRYHARSKPAQLLVYDPEFGICDNPAE